jgi:hypothetical protein
MGWYYVNTHGLALREYDPNLTCFYSFIHVYVMFQHYYRLKVKLKVLIHKGATTVIMLSVECNTVELTLCNLKTLHCNAVQISHFDTEKHRNFSIKP